MRQFSILDLYSMSLFDIALYKPDLYLKTVPTTFWNIIENYSNFFKSLLFDFYQENGLRVVNSEKTIYLQMSSLTCIDNICRYVYGGPRDGAGSEISLLQTSVDIIIIRSTPRCV